MKRLLYVAILIAVSIAGGYLLVEEPKKTKKLSELQSNSELYMEQLSIYQYDAQGKRIHKIKADRADFFENNKMATLDNPQVFTEYKDHQWKISSYQAIANDNYQAIDLTNSVHVQTMEENESDQLHVITSNLHYDAAKQILSTEQSVQIKDGSRNLSGIGFSADMAQEVYQLKQQVEASYETRPSKTQ
ncbi:LPS export ABC transporter periplasmic protein LptC [Pleionea sp. CnH1-48]|uniref:LPS export ABC transporter periplasmic protein LptC n=1 Tax=Pleionea sp. CnH1-48 TaxID=2954494 RepID=UPI002096D13B|nr:LPS export ABC transporter periplasmic protein LptC [Pleionea sp. CnH1-48]MCO7224030.1 LPS export ABC transporter periplasmic protein LptC [Pleionea sp. CnH1-48]